MDASREKVLLLYRQRRYELAAALSYGAGCLLSVGIASRPHDDKTAETPS